MKSTLKKCSYIVILASVASLLSGCSLFHRKKKCADCPKWSKIEVTHSLEKHI